MERFILVKLNGNTNARLRKQGYVAEIIDLQHPSDDGPVAIARCFTLEDAERIVRALQLLWKF